VTVTVRTWPGVRFCGVASEVPVNSVNVRFELPPGGVVLLVLSVRHVCGATFEAGGFAGFVALMSVVQKAVAVSTALTATFCVAV
jgi:hypothetical protein